MTRKRKTVKKRPTRPPEGHLSWVLGLCALGLAVWPVACHDAVSRARPSLSKTVVEVRANQRAIAAGYALLKDGDLVLRSGTDFVSLTLRQFSLRDKTYSHCGIVRREKDSLYVYHAIGGEDNPKATLRRDTFSAFCDPDHNSGFAIYRYRLDRSALHRLDSIVALQYRRKLPFDLQFDLRTDDRQYCAEFVYKSVNAAVGDACYLPETRLGGLNYVAIDNLYLYPHAREIYRGVFR